MQFNKEINLSKKEMAQQSKEQNTNTLKDEPTHRGIVQRYMAGSGLAIRGINQQSLRILERNKKEAQKRAEAARKA